VHKKVSFNSYKQAQRRASRLPIPGHIYWCPHTGGWHITRHELGDYDRRQAEYLNRNCEENDDE
jgi:2'-5' RNA ligase